MKNSTLPLISLFLLFCFFSSIPFAQERYDPHGRIRDQLISLIQMKYGSDFQNVGYTIFDSLIIHSNSRMQSIQDPHKSLDNCILFSTYKNCGESLPDTFIVGMMKNGRIIWDNVPGTKADLGGDLLYAKDINNDGEVDLLISEKDREFSLMGRGPFLYYLYILSWNGTNGIFINAFDTSGCSALMGDGDFELKYVSGNAIPKIVATLPDIDLDWGSYRTKSFPIITYSWNGRQYGF
jgi:hypothetical protein